MVAILAAATSAAYSLRDPLTDLAVARWRVARLHWLERGCLNYEPPPDRLVYDDHPGQPVPLPPAGDGQYTTGPGDEWSPPDPTNPNLTAWSPGPLMRWLKVAGGLEYRGGSTGVPAVTDATFAAPNGTCDLGDPVRGVAFVHDRVAPCGRHRLVCVSVSGPTSRLTAYVFKVGSFTRSADLVAPRPGDRTGSVLLTRDTAADHMHLYAGRADPVDPARFTITGDYNGRPFIVGGRLDDEDHVTLAPTAGWNQTRPVYVTDVAVPITAWPVGYTGMDGVSADTIRFTADGRDVVLVDYGVALEISAKDGRTAWCLDLPADHPSAIPLSPDGRAVAIVNPNQPTRLLSLPGRTVLLDARVSVPRQSSFGPDALVEFTEDEVFWWRLSDRSLRRWRPTGGVLLAAFAVSFGRCVVLTQSPVLTARGEPAAAEGRSWLTARTFGPPGSVPSPPVVICSLPNTDDGNARWRVSLSGRYVAGNLAAGRKMLFDLWAGQPVEDGVIPLTSSPAVPMFSPDGRLVAWVDLGGQPSVMVMDVGTNQLYHLANVRASAVAFSPDGRTMAGVWDAALHLWPTPGR